MKYSILLSLLLSLNFCTSAQPEVKTIINDSNAEKRTVESFTGIKVKSAISVYLSQGNEDAVAISSSDRSDNKKIKTEVKNGTLNIYLDNGFWNGWNWKEKNIKVYVSIRTIQLLDVSGASTIKITDPILSKNLRIEASGASTIKGEIKATNIKLNLSGASNINIKGIAGDAVIEASGASSLKSYDFVCESAKIEASGASSISISVIKEINAEASGASSINYKGTAAIIKSNSSGASSIKKKND